jgi:hypothetical protein
VFASDRPGNGDPLVAGDPESDIAGVGDYSGISVGPGDFDAVVTRGIINDNDMDGDAPRFGRFGYRRQTFVQEGSDVVTDDYGDGVRRIVTEIGQVRRHWVGDVRGFCGRSVRMNQAG